MKTLTTWGAIIGMATVVAVTAVALQNQASAQGAGPQVGQARGVEGQVFQPPQGGFQGQGQNGQIRPNQGMPSSMATDGEHIYILMGTRLIKVTKKDLQIEKELDVRPNGGFGGQRPNPIPQRNENN